MKKILICFLIILSCSIGFVGCNNLQGEYWKDSQVLANTIFTGEDFNKAYNIDFNSNLDTIISSTYGNDYAELTNVLSPLFNSAISYAYYHYNDLLITPKNTSNAFKDQIVIVNNNLNAFSSTVKNFNDRKTTYESFINFSSQEKATSEIEKARLLLFKREYISLIESAYSLSNSLYMARRIGYYDFSNYADTNLEIADINAECSLAINLTNLEITNCAIRIVRAYNAKEMASNYKNYTDLANQFYVDVVQKLNTNVLTPNLNAKEKLLAWKNVNELFNSECNKFYNVLEKINLGILTESQNNAKKYAELTTSEIDEVYANFFLSFYGNLSTMKTYCLNIFN